jgi:hypothetical protein
MKVSILRHAALFSSALAYPTLHQNDATPASDFTPQAVPTADSSNSAAALNFSALDQTGPADVTIPVNAATGCTAVTVIFARGTTEPGTVGLLAGPPFFSALESMIGADAVTVQGVSYPAVIPGFLAGGDKQGSQTMSVTSFISNLGLY